ncbi:MAG: hypothetical protein HGA99_08775 [Chlorobiaceae bacterium]|nr:hypothetical protein [Chlorobiaceae bacterium]
MTEANLYDRNAEGSRESTTPEDRSHEREFPLSLSIMLFYMAELELGVPGLGLYIPREYTAPAP